MNNKKATILLVEDDKINQFVACKLLQKWGISVTVANNGVEAIAQICDKSFELVLMDLQMPVMDGFESTQQIRSMDDLYFKTVPILACTASGLIEAKEKAIEKGMNDFIAKPLSLENLQDKIYKYLPSLRRPLFINFNSYTEGDPDFKNELISLLIENIKELQQSLMCHAPNATKIFPGIYHKVKSTIGMLSDQDLSDALEEYKSLLGSSQKDEVFQRKQNYLNELCERVIESLAAARFAPGLSEQTSTGYAA